MHLTCHLCDDAYKNYYYSDYIKLEIHFQKSHFLCPYDDCKSKCYVAFQTENELKAHNEIIHMKKAINQSANVNSWLNFKDDDDENTSKFKKVKQPKNVLKDNEGIDFHYYFTQKYQMVHSRKGGKHQKRDEDEQKTSKKEENPDKTFRGVGDNHEKKLALIYEFLHKFLYDKFKSGAFKDDFKAQ